MEKKQSSWSLQTLIPLLIALTGLSVILAQYIVSYRFESEHVRQESTQRLNAIGSRLVRMSSELTEPEDLLVLNEEMAAMKKMAGLTHIVLVNEHDKVMASTAGYEQHIDSNILISAIPNDIEDFANGQVNEVQKGKLMTATFAFDLPAGFIDDNSKPIGVISVGKDLQIPMRAEQNVLRKIATVSGLLVLLVAGLFWAFMRRFLTKPLNRLVSTTRRFAAGDFSTQAGQMPRNELGEISIALETLRSSVEQKEQAQANSNRLAQIIEESVNEIFVADASTYQITSTNRAARDNLGYSREETQNLKPWDFVVGLTKDGMEELIAPLQEGVLDALEFETIQKRKDGTKYPVATNLQYMSTQNPPVYVAIAQDITERTRQEESIRLRNDAIDAVDVGVSITDAREENYPLVYVNQTLCAMTGYTAEELIGQGVRILQKDDQNQPEHQKIQIAQAKGDPVTVLFKSTRKDGSTYMDELSLSPIYSAEKELTHYIGINRDVTAKLETEARLYRSEKIDAIGQLSGGIAHDFNNLLNVIIGNLEFLAADITDKEHRDYINEADNAAQMGARLTRRLLAFAKQGQLEPTVLNANEHVLTALELLRSTIGENISLSSNLSSDAWSICADPSEIENTVVNLAINARDAMPNGGKITISTKNASISEDDIEDDFGIAPGDYVQLSVSDTGCGMTNEIKEKIFEPFFTTKDQGKGTGLGLASIYGFARQSGGHVHVYSEVDHGTVINVYLPRHNDSPTRSRKDKTPSKITGQPNAKILVVDDNEMVLNVTVRRLRTLNYNVVQASSGPEAIELLKEVTVDLILTDIVMEGGMSGFDVAQWAQKNLPQCKILLTSGFNEQMTEGTGVNTENLQVLQKPYNRDELQQALNQALETTPANV